MDEFKFIDAIKPMFYKQSSVIKGIGDDAAVVHPPSHFHLVIATDTMVEDVHFSFEYMEGEDVGYRALAANISDLAAMGANPMYYLVNISGPNNIEQETLVSVINGMKELADDYQMDLIGGDTTTSKELMITVTVFGHVHIGTQRYRSLAQKGDIVFVTGYLGASGYGFHQLKNQFSTDTDYFINRHKRPKPRVDFSTAISKLSRVCLNDVSDGISSELNEIAEASHVAIDIQWEALPIHEGMTYLPKENLKKFVLSSGEDFELVGTCRKEQWADIKEICETKQIKVTRIGQVTDESVKQPIVYLTEDNQKTILQKSGYQHGKSGD